MRLPLYTKIRVHCFRRFGFRLGLALWFTGFGGWKRGPYSDCTCWWCKSIGVQVCRTHSILKLNLNIMYRGCSTRGIGKNDNNVHVKGHSAARLWVWWGAENRICSLHCVWRAKTTNGIFYKWIKTSVLCCALGNGKMESGVINLDRVRYEIPEVWNIGEEKKCGRLVYTAESR